MSQPLELYTVFREQAICKKEQKWKKAYLIKIYKKKEPTICLYCSTTRGKKRMGFGIVM